MGEPLDLEPESPFQVRGGAPYAQREPCSLFIKGRGPCPCSSPNGRMQESHVRICTVFTVTRCFYPRSEPNFREWNSARKESGCLG
jgi:hypothetical protein